VRSLNSTDLTILGRNQKTGPGCIERGRAKKEKRTGRKCTGTKKEGQYTRGAFLGEKHLLLRKSSHKEGLRKNKKDLSKSGKGVSRIFSSEAFNILHHASVRR